MTGFSNRLGLRLQGVAVALALCVLAACSSDPAESQLTGGGEDQIEFSSPLARRIGFDFLDSSVEQQMARAESVALCMAAEGFEYIAWVPPSIAQQAEFLGDTREWAGEWGFGASTLLFPAELVDPAKGYEGLDSAATTDPNLEIMAALPPSELDAYGRALFGEEQSPDLVSSQGGCIAAGVDEDQIRIVNELLAEFDIELASLDARVQAHPDMLAFEDALRECIVARGFQWTNRDQAEERFLALASAIGVEADPSAENIAELSDLQEAEIELALAEYDCGGSSSERNRVEAAIRGELEAEFIAANADSLARILGD